MKIEGKHKKQTYANDLRLNLQHAKPTLVITRGGNSTIAHLMMNQRTVVRIVGRPLRNSRADKNSASVHRELQYYLMHVVQSLNDWNGSPNEVAGLHDVLEFCTPEEAQITDTASTALTAAYHF